MMNQKMNTPLKPMKKKIQQEKYISKNQKYKNNSTKHKLLDQQQKTELKNILLREKPDIVCLQESFLKGKNLFNGYQCYRW